MRKVMIVAMIPKAKMVRTKMIQMARKRKRRRKRKIKRRLSPKLLSNL